MRQRQHREGHKVILHVDLDPGTSLHQLSIELDKPVTLRAGEELLVELCIPALYAEQIFPASRPMTVTTVTI